MLDSWRSLAHLGTLGAFRFERSVVLLPAAHPGGEACRHMDIGVSMRPSVLEGKLDCADTNRPEQAWNMARWPSGLDGKGPHRLFVASGGHWLGYFVISPEALYLPEDTKTPYALLFDTRTWTEITPVRARRFRGFTYKVPDLDVEPTSSP